MLLHCRIPAIVKMKNVKLNNLMSGLLLALASTGPMYAGNSENTRMNTAASQQISGTLPVLYINVYKADGTLDNEVTDRNLGHKHYFSGRYWLDLNG